MRLGPTKPQITEASKKTRSLGHVQGLFCGRRFFWHMFSTEFKSHHATLRSTVPTKMVPMYDVERVICFIFQINFKQELSAYTVPSFFFC